ncbi:apolipoprotein A-II [Phyllobates terribilis]|uniref:apolipoprotein A-II n=1 Tax=Phyllobates terribilis TaxID=111132 RepID=UPI003CCA8554
MKVLALTVLILVIGSLEAGIVKREVASAQQVSEILQNWFETFKTSIHEVAQKVQNGEIQAHAGQLLEQTKSQTDPIKEEIEKIFAKLVDAGKKLAAS